MNYELAKQLKEAGFPQPEPIEIPEFLPDNLRRTELVWEIKEDVYTPSLSKLIEACGVGFGSLNQLDDETYPEQWSASIYNELDKCVIGSTPEEAVANLWLELNKKND